MKKIWHKNKTASVHPAVERYLTGDDHFMDGILLPYDIRGSIAHAEGLERIKVITPREKNLLVAGLTRIHELWKNGKVVITPADEDCHTVIERMLTKQLGARGKKIHTGRSRNDQVLTALRLYMKEKLAHVAAEVQDLTNAFRKAASKNKNLAMPGYTHMQRAMPSSISLWLGAYAEALKDDATLVRAVLSVIDQSPLGSVVGYGEHSLGLDRKFVAKKLGFAKVQKNALYAANSRGKFELLTLQALEPIMLDIGKFATDSLLFSTREFGFLLLPPQFLTGSSAMPHKRNYDVLELMRARASEFVGSVATLAILIDKLPSGYNRDLQLTKKIFMNAVENAVDTMRVTSLVVQNIEFDVVALDAAMSEELYATEEAYELVKKGIPFREAYQTVAKKYNHDEQK